MASPRGSPVSASRPEGRSRARIGRVLTGSSRRSPGRATPRPAASGRSRAGRRPASRRLGARGRRSDRSRRLRARARPLDRSRPLEDIPLDRGIAFEVCRVAKPGEADVEAPGVEVPGDHAAVAPVVPRAAGDDDPARAPILSRSQPAAPRPAFSIRTIVGSLNPSSARASIPRTSSRDSGRTFIGVASFRALTIGTVGRLQNNQSRGPKSNATDPQRTTPMPMYEFQLRALRPRLRDPRPEARATSPTARSARGPPCSSNSASPPPPGPRQEREPPCQWPSPDREEAAEPPGAAPGDAAGWAEDR